MSLKIKALVGDLTDNNSSIHKRIRVSSVSISGKKQMIYFCCILCFLFSCSQLINTTPIPFSSQQMILVLTGSVAATCGTLYRFERESATSEWKLSGENIPVVIGRNGLGWGRGLHREPKISGFPMKEEGDGRSPAGAFRLSAVFGYLPEDQMQNLKMPYLHITEMTECVDDPNSQYYNTIVSVNEIAEEKVDWQSSEKMRHAGIYYELGVVVEHNRHPIKKGAGSCLFLHNWSTPDETMAGCTGMEPLKMKETVCWLDAAKKPILIQLSKQLYIDFRKLWELPELPVD